MPADLSAQVAKAGGTLTSGIGQVGVAVASSDDPSFADRAGKIKGVFSVELDPMVQWVQPEHVVEAGEGLQAAQLPGGCDASALGLRLAREHGIEVNAQPWNGTPLIRISVQGYNTVADLDRLLSVLPALIEA